VYDSFGNCQIQTAEIVNNLRFPGQYFDAETGLYYNFNRYYDPTIGRYLRTDPYGEGLNLYAYVFNDPVNGIDPMGLCKESDILDAIQNALDIAGTFDPTPIIDVFNGVGYAFRGKWFDALGSGISAFPYLGDILGKGGKLIKRGVEHADEAVDLLKTTKRADKGGLNLFKWREKSSSKATGWKEGDNFLHLPNKGDRKAKWKRNSGQLREEMRKGKPIYDSYRDPATGKQIPTGGFLNAERKLLESRGWKYNPSTGAYHPPSN
jgi:RHS repeat-associated protein